MISLANKTLHTEPRAARLPKSMSFVPVTALFANGLLSWLPIIASVVMGAFGGLILLVGLGFLFQTVWLMCSGSRVIATVMGYRNEEEEFYHHEDISGHTLAERTSVTFQVPVFTFDDDNGQTHEVAGMGTMKKRFQKGDQVALIYSPSNPKRCIVDDFLNKWVTALSAFFVGVILLIFPAYMVFTWFAG